MQHRPTPRSLRARAAAFVLCVATGPAFPAAPAQVELGPDVRLSDVGTDGDPAFAASELALAHDPARDEFLVSWTGDDDTGVLVEGKFEIHGQRVAPAAAGLLVLGTGPDAWRFSTHGHTWTAQVGAVQAAYPLGGYRAPSLVLPTPGEWEHHANEPAWLPSASASAAAHLPIAPRGLVESAFSVQILLRDTPGHPARTRHSLAVQVGPDGRVLSLPYGMADGLDLRAESEVDGSGGLLLRLACLPTVP